MENRPKANTLRLSQGFTLLEMLITIAIVSILVGLAIIGMQPLIERSQSESTVSELQLDLVFSRGEAIKRGGWVGFCGSENRTSCNDSLQNGWMVFHDVNKDRMFNNTDTVLSWTDNEYGSITVELEETDGAAGGPIIFNYRGYPDRSVLIRAKKGDANESFILQKTGGLILE